MSKVKKSRSAEYSSAIKSGAVKESVDSGLRLLVKPMVAAMAPRLGDIENVKDVDMADSSIQIGLEFAVLQAVSEVAAAASGVAEKIPGLDLDENARDKLLAFSKLTRHYSGDRLGDKVAEHAVKFLPFVKKLLTDVTMGGSFDTTAEQGTMSLPEPTEKVDIFSMFEDKEVNDDEQL